MMCRRRVDHYPKTRRAMLESAKTQRVERGDCSAGVYVHTVCVELVGTDGEAGHVSRTSTFTRDFAEDVSIRALDMVVPPPLNKSR